MVNIIEVTKKTSNEYGKGLLTHLFFDEEIETDPTENRTFNIVIDTCIVPDSKEYPYEIFVQDHKGNELYATRCRKEEMISNHFKIVNEYKEKYFKQEG